MKPPQDLLSLLLTSSTLYYSLSTNSAPHLYACIYRNTFDFDTTGVHFDMNQVTDSRLTAEREDNMMSNDLLCVAMRMIVESTGTNEAYIRQAGFLGFIFLYATRCLTEYQHHPQARTDMDLALWLLALTWSRDELAKISQKDQNNLLLLLRPLMQIASRGTIQNKHSVPSPKNADESLSGWDSGVVCPSAASAAIILNFALLEAGNTKVPPQSPSRNDLTGPTMEDYYVMANYQTPLFGDDCPALEAEAILRQERPIKHDPQFFHPKLPGSDAYYRLPDLITGTWEGVYTVSCSDTKKTAPPSPDTPDFICKKALQWSLELYFCFDADAPAAKCIEGEESFLAVSGNQIPYDKFVPTRFRDCQLSQALDCLVIGRNMTEPGEGSALPED
ncbi:hypothetical protein BDP27DRAFT_1359494 [Rhodocollybia butyracea]|uniref:Uncharacterized protein n=1 Tax=Rhodocollybia butyracea TaxID=206335 RepID=A0A9P5UDM3_9AGAR|nr:hypothetical protein BDP27DRAFT_1359494 [Rhodocollybia butyracea]